MKKIEIPKTTYDFEYEAFDGTRFKNMENCQIYEDSASGVLLRRLKPFHTFCEEDIGGSSEVEVRVVIITEENLFEARQLALIYHYSKEIESGDIIMISIRYYCEAIDGLWIRNINDFIKNVAGENFILTNKTPLPKEHVDDVSQMNY